MAPKQPAALKNPPPADTSSEEEEESDEEVPETQTKTPQKPDSSEDESDQSSSDEEEEDKENKKPSVDANSDSDSDEEDEPEDKNKSSVNKSDSGSDEDDADAGSDTESADTAPLKVEPKEVVKPKPVEVVIASPAVKSAVSNQKKGKASVADEKKSPAFTRVFGDDDEVAVLKGMDEFRKKTDRDPNVDRDGFFEFMKKSLKIEVSKSQLIDKVRRLKKKYQNHVKKGDDPVITKPHELKLYELSKKVWGGDVAESAVKAVKKRKAVKDAGSDDVASEGAKSKKKPKVSMDLVVKENGAAKGGLELGEKAKSDPEGWDAFPHFKEVLEVESSGYYFKRLVDFNKIGAKKAKEMEDLWRAYHVKELELKSKELELKSAKVELQEKTTKLLHDTLKS